MKVCSPLCLTRAGLCEHQQGVIMDGPSSAQGSAQQESSQLHKAGALQPLLCTYWWALCKFISCHQLDIQVFALGLPSGLDQSLQNLTGGKGRR